MTTLRWITCVTLVLIPSRALACEQNDSEEVPAREPEIALDYEKDEKNDSVWVTATYPTSHTNWPLLSAVLVVGNPNAPDVTAPLRITEFDGEYYSTFELKNSFVEEAIVITTFGYINLGCSKVVLTEIGSKEPEEPVADE